MILVALSQIFVRRKFFFSCSVKTEEYTSTWRIYKPGEYVFKPGDLNFLVQNVITNFIKDIDANIIQDMRRHVMLNPSLKKYYVRE